MSASATITRTSPGAAASRVAAGASSLFFQSFSNSSRSHAPSRASSVGGQGSVDDIPTASPFDVVGEDDLAPPAATLRPVSQPAVRALVKAAGPLSH